MSDLNIVRISSLHDEEDDEPNDQANACFVSQSLEPLICEEQAMRGCDFEDGEYQSNEFPCDVDLLQMRLKSDFFLKANPKTLPFAQAFADDPALLAVEFGTAYHKITHIGLDRCGLSGHGCPTDHTCENIGDNPLVVSCVFQEPKLAENASSAANDFDILNEDDDEALDALYYVLAGIALVLVSTTLILVVKILAKVKTMEKLGTQPISDRKRGRDDSSSRTSQEGKSRSDV